MIKVFLLHTQNSGVSYVRQIQYAKFMRRLPDTEVAYSKWTSGRQTMARWMYEIRKNKRVVQDFKMLFENSDITVAQLVTTPEAVALLGAAREKYKKPILMESDDYFLNSPSYHPVSKVYTPNSDYQRWGLIQMRFADAMIVSTPWLKKKYGEIFKRPIYVIRNGIDFEIWDKLKEPKSHKGIIIGWRGGGSHNGDLLMIEPVIHKILEKYSNVRFVITGGGVPRMKKHKRLTARFLWVKDHLKYPQSLKNAGFDIGIAPLLDNEFNYAKSNLRWLEWSALRIPTVASRIEHFKKTIKVNQTGFLAKGEDEWIERLSELIENDQLRWQMGRDAYDEVKKNFNIEKIAKEYLFILEGICQKGFS